MDTYKLSLRDLLEMCLIRGIVFSHEAVRDWETKLTPALAESLWRRQRGKAEGSREANELPHGWPPAHSPATRTGSMQHGHYRRTCRTPSMSGTRKRSPKTQPDWHGTMILAVTPGAQVNVTMPPQRQLGE
jgi:hypothetical protein